MNLPLPPPSHPIPAPAVIVRDVAVAGVVLIAGAILTTSGANVAGVAGGGLAAVLMMGSMAWAIQTVHPGWMMVRMLLQWSTTLLLGWGLVVSLPPGPVMIGISSLVLGVAGRVAMLLLQTPASEVA